MLYARTIYRLWFQILHITVLVLPLLCVVNPLILLLIAIGRMYLSVWVSCKNPFLRKTDEGKIVTIPCGWCIQCRIANRNSWVTRWEHEKIYNPLAFVTLTYTDDDMPYVLVNDSYSHGHKFQPTLWPEDVQKFMKRLRINLVRGKSYNPDTKYVVVGEYGQEQDKQLYYHLYGRPFGRPHYHLIISGYDILNLAFRHAVKKSWSLGNIKILPVLKGGISYVYKYLDKQVHGLDAFEVYNYLTPPFKYQSKGIGERYLREHVGQVENDGGFRNCKFVAPVGRYWRDKYGLSPRPYDSTFSDKLKREYPNESYIKALELAGDVKERELAQKINLFGV